MLPGWFEMYVRLEQAASVIHGYQVQFVPGLFQTEEYARAVIAADAVGEAAHEVEQRVHLRMARQKLLTEPNAPQFRAVLDEGAVRRTYGPARVMREQLEHLAALADLPNVTLQVLPFDRGGPAAAAGPFTMLRFAEDDLPDIVYLEQLTSAVYLDKPADVELYRSGDGPDRGGGGDAGRQPRAAGDDRPPALTALSSRSAGPAPGSSSPRPPSGPGRARCARRARASAARPGRTPRGRARGTASTR